MSKKEIFNKILHPNLLVKILTFIICVLSSTASIIMAIMGELSVISYILFAVAGLSLAYATYIFVKGFKNIKIGIIKILEKTEFTKLLIESYGFRTTIFSFFSLLLGVAFASFNAVMGVYYKSIWYGALSAYYLSLVSMRSGVLISRLKKSKDQKSIAQNPVRQSKVYRNCGIALIVLNVALSSAIAQMIFDEKVFVYAGWTVFAYAAYAFYKIIMSVVNILKAKKQTDLTVLAMRNINFVGAVVSIMALQTALLDSFNDGSVSASVFNTITGSLVSITIVTLAIIMTVKGIKILKKRKTKDGRQQI